MLSACLSQPEAITEYPGAGGSGIPPSGANSPPVVSGNPLNIVKIDESYAFRPNAWDPDGDSLSFNIQNKPDWLAFETTSGRLSGTPVAGNEGDYRDISISASDGSDTASLMFSITVTSVGAAFVTLDWTPPTENEDGTVLTDLAGYKIYYGVTAGTYPNSIRIDNPGLSTYVVDNLTPRAYYFVATSINAMGVESQYSNMAVKVAN